MLTQHSLHIDTAYQHNLLWQCFELEFVSTAGAVELSEHSLVRDTGAAGKYHPRLDLKQSPQFRILGSDIKVTKPCSLPDTALCAGAEGQDACDVSFRKVLAKDKLQLYCRVTEEDHWFVKAGGSGTRSNLNLRNYC